MGIHIAWDYEKLSPPHESYYNVYGLTDAGDRVIGEGSLAIEVPLTKANTSDINIIVEALNRIAERIGDGD